MGEKSQYEDIYKTEGGEIGDEGGEMKSEECCEPYFSIIIPAYNAAKYLPDIIRCIKQQTFKNYEAIIIDDGSTDDTKKISKLFSDEKIRFLHKSVNEGLSEARNTGMREIKGKYVFFWDADDTIDNDILENIKNVLEINEYDLVIYGVKEKYCDSSGKIIYEKSTIPEKIETDKKNDIYKIAVKLEAQTILGYAWNKCYRVAFLRNNGFIFKNIRLIEDIEFNIRVFDRIHALCVIDRACYTYIKRHNDSLTEGDIPGYFDLNSKRIEILMDYYKKWGCFESIGKNQLTKTYMRYIYSALERNISTKDFERQKEWLKECFKGSLYNELINQSQLKEKGYYSIMLKFLQRRNIWQILLLSNLLHICKYYFRPVFLRFAKR